MRKGSKRLLGTCVLGGLAYAGWQAWRARVPRPAHDIAWESAPFPFPPVPRPSTSGTPAPPRLVTFTDPDTDGSCPATHPVKVKLSSGIFHLPGGGNYNRTKPDRCYVDAEAAERDGYRAAKR